jgi:UDP-N-acetylglucosamine 4,6-dehydratase/5-epimerase
MKRKLSKNVINELKNKTILITGGAGSIGTILTKRLLEYPIKQVRVLDINEHALFKLNKFVNSDSRLRLLLGNIENLERVQMAGYKVDIVIHTAAIKNIEISESNPIETIETNVNGTVNLIKMATKNKPKKFLTISTDKAVESSTLYGATKLLSEKITSWAGLHIAPTKFATARFGNVMETRGNVFEVWDEEIKNQKPISITHPKMKRYFFHIDDAVDFILECLPIIKSGEIFIPKMESYSIKKLADKVSKNQKIIGLRKGEKIEEELMTHREKKNVIETKNMWIIKPNE